MEKLCGYAGKLLRVNLTDEEFTDEKLDEKTLRKYVGGTGLGAKYLYEEVHSGVEWSDEDNRIIIASGPLGGTAIGGSGTISAVTKGPLTNGAGAVQANGIFGAFLRFSGYDGIILYGKAKRWVYLYINGSRAELRDASPLVGKDSWYTADLIKSELGMKGREVSIASIGLAGENLVKYACLVIDKGHIASHNGVGAVMGSKKLKAIAVARRTTRPTLKDQETISTIAKRMHNDILNSPMAKEGIYTWGTLNGVYHGMTAMGGSLPIKNYTTNIPYEIEPEQLEKFSASYIRSHYKPKPVPCWACRFHHCHEITIPEEPYRGCIGEEPEYESMASFGPVIGGANAAATIFLANEVDRLGMDSNETGWVIGLVMECFEKGILSREDCDGLEMTWGNYEAVNKIIHMIAVREGFGSLLAEGAMRTAQSIGDEAPNFAIHTMKGNTPRVHDHRTMWPMLFDTCLSQMSSDEGYIMARPADLGLSINPPTMGTNNSLEDTLDWNVQCKGARQLEDCLGVCRYNTNTDLKLIAETVSASTGWDFSAEEALTVGKRIVNLLRVFNIRHGHTAEMDAPSARYGSTPMDGPSQGKDIMPYWNELRSKYYELMGWDKETGKPLPDTLRDVGLEYTISELWES